MLQQTAIILTLLSCSWPASGNQILQLVENIMHKKAQIIQQETALQQLSQTLKQKNTQQLKTQQELQDITQAKQQKHQQYHQQKIRSEDEPLKYSVDKAQQAYIQAVKQEDRLQENLRLLQHQEHLENIRYTLRQQTLIADKKRLHNEEFHLLTLRLKRLKRALEKGIMVTSKAEITCDDERFLCRREARLKAIAMGSDDSYEPYEKIILNELSHLTKEHIAQETLQNVLSSLKMVSRKKISTGCDRDYECALYHYELRGRVKPAFNHQQLCTLLTIPAEPCQQMAPSTP